MPTLLALLPSNTYRARDLLRAAAALRIDLVIGTDRQQVLEPETADTTVTLPFDDTAAAVQRVRALHSRRPLDAVLGLDDETAWAAAVLADAMGLPGNPPAAVELTRSKLNVRRALAAAGIRGPEFAAYRLRDLHRQAPGQRYPCVLKPTFLSASRGVIRADNPSEFLAASRRIAAILQQPELRSQGGPESEVVLVESYLPGSEIALEGVLDQGRLRPVAIFDKPDPLVGPYFEETIYVTPSRHDAAALHDAREQVQRAVQAVGLRRGPIHAELRIDAGAATLLELAPRPLGGLCPRVMPLAFDVGLEHLALGAALAHAAPRLVPRQAAGVMMIPIPAAGRLNAVRGLAAAQRCCHVAGVEIAIGLGQEVVPLPEGNRYLGFIFAGAADPSTVEAALRSAHDCLRFDIEATRDPEPGAGGR